MTDCEAGKIAAMTKADTQCRGEQEMNRKKK